MRFLFVLVGGGVGLLVGAIAGVCVGLIVMSFTKQPGGGTYGMLDMAVCVPGGAALGFIAGLAWGLTTKLAMS